MKSTSSNQAANVTQNQDTEVTARPTRRIFTVAYKRQILAECDIADAARLGAILRREGLYSCHLTTWRRLFAHAHQADVVPTKRGRTPNLDKDSPKRMRNINDLQSSLRLKLMPSSTSKKVSALLGINLETNSDESSGWLAWMPSSS